MVSGTSDEAEASHRVRMKPAGGEPPPPPGSGALNPAAGKVSGDSWNPHPLLKPLPS